MIEILTGGSPTFGKWAAQPRPKIDIDAEVIDSGYLGSVQFRGDDWRGREKTVRSNLVDALKILERVRDILVNKPELLEFYKFIPVQKQILDPNFRNAYVKKIDLILSHARGVKNSVTLEVHDELTEQQRRVHASNFDQSDINQPIQAKRGKYRGNRRALSARQNNNESTYVMSLFRLLRAFLRPPIIRLEIAWDKC